MSAPLLRLAACFGIAWSAAWAQDASITGIVTDPSNALVVGSKVIVRNVDTNVARTIESNHEGAYTVTGLRPGSYELTAEMQGFRTYKSTGIVLEVGDALRADIHLTLGATTDSVVVNAEVAALNTERGALTGDVIVQREIQDLPLQSRDFTDLATLVPGVTPGADGAQGGGLNIGGARADSTNYYVDGFSSREVRSAVIQTRPNLGAVQEFRMEVSGFSAEYGRFAGGVMNMVLRSGTNDYHGELFEYIRNDLMDARAFFDQDKLGLHRNQFGATFHGPIQLPKIYNGRNKTFFMFSWESQRQVLGSTGIGHVPSLLERGGNFSQSFSQTAARLVVTDPLNNNVAFPGNIIPTNRIHPIVNKLLPYYPLPNRADPRNNWITASSNRNNFDSYIGKLDHRFDEKNSLSYRYQIRSSNTVDPFPNSNLGTFAHTASDDRSLMGLNYTHLFSPAVLIEFNAGYSRGTSFSNSVWGNRDIASEIGLTGTTHDPFLIGFPLFQITGYDSLGERDDQPVQFAITGIQTGVKLTWIKSRHVMKWGFDGLKDYHNQEAYRNNRGTFNFTGSWTTAPMADFLLGVMNSTTRSVGGPRHYMRNTSLGGFFNDDFKVLPNLTLNLGVRYEVDTLPYHKYDLMSNFVPSLNKIVLATQRTPAMDALIAGNGLQNYVAYAADVGLGRSLVNADRNNIAPRFGFAWTPWGNRKTVLRGGYGIFYTGSLSNPFRNNLATNFPFAVNETYSRVATRPDLVSLSNPFPSDRVSVGGVTSSNGLNINPRTGYMQSYNLMIEREIGGGTALEMGYTGSKGTHLARARDINIPRYSAAAYIAGTAVQNLRPFPYLNGTINYFDFRDNSIYNAGQVSLRKRGRGGAFYRLSYTYSKSIDTSSQLNQTSTAGLTAAAQDSTNYRLDRGRSDWDRGHIVTASFAWMLPIGRGQKLFRSAKGFEQTILGGWQLSGTSSFATGAAMTPVTAGINLNNGDSQKPNRIGTGIPDEIPGQRRGVDYPWFVLSDFVKVPSCVSAKVGCPADQYGFQPFVYGNSGRNILDGPGLAYINLSMLKNFRISEGKSFQFRFESFNVMNHPNFVVPNNQFNTANGGLITDVVASGRGGARVFQAALRFAF